MKSCSERYKSRKVQSFIKNEWKKESEEILKETGTASPYNWKYFKNVLKKGFMKSCRRRRTNGSAPHGASPKTRRRVPTTPLLK